MAADSCHTGYKESHDWVADYNIFSPLIFDADWYALAYDLTDKTHNEIKADWAAHIQDQANSFPKKCRQGHALFSVSMAASLSRLLPLFFSLSLPLIAHCYFPFSLSAPVIFSLSSPVLLFK